MLIGGEKENDVRLKAKKHHVAPFNVKSITLSILSLNFNIKKLSLSNLFLLLCIFGETLSNIFRKIH